MNSHLESFEAFLLLFSDLKTADLFIFTKEIHNGKLIFLCSVNPLEIKAGYEYQCELNDLFFLPILIFGNSKLADSLLVNMLIEIFSLAPSSASFFCFWFCPVLAVELSALLWPNILAWTAVVVLTHSHRLFQAYQ